MIQPSPGPKPNHLHCLHRALITIITIITTTDYLFLPSSRLGQTYRHHLHRRAAPRSLQVCKHHCHLCQCHDQHCHCFCNFHCHLVARLSPLLVISGKYSSSRSSCLKPGRVEKRKNLSSEKRRFGGESKNLQNGEREQLQS